MRKLDFSRLSNKQLFEWIKTHRSQAALLALEERWISFWETVKNRIGRAEQSMRAVEDDIEKMDSQVSRLEWRLTDVQAKLKMFTKTKADKRLRLIKNNLESVERQLRARDPKPMIPESTWEAFEEFLIKLNGNKR